MKVKGIIWLEEIIQKLQSKHAVDQDELREVLAGQPMFRFVEKGHRRGENVYAAFGLTEAGRRLVVFFVHKADGRALILWAREMAQAERRHYDKSQK